MIHVKEMVWYVFIGISAALIHFIGLYFGVECLNLSAACGNVFGFFWAFWVSFLGHFFLTFRTHQLFGLTFIIFFKSLYRWLITSVGGFLLNQGLFLIGLKFLGEKLYLINWLIATLFVMVLTFVSGKFWGFRHTK